MTNDQGRLVLVVDSDQRFVDDARPLLAAHRVVAASDIDEAREIVLGGRIDLVLLGPAFGSDAAVSQARVLLDADPSLQIALAADVVTNRLLKAALKGGLVDVLDVPLNDRDVGDLLRDLTSRPQQATELAFVVEPAPPVQVAVPAESDPVPLDSPDPAVDPDEPVPLDEETMPASEFPAAATDDPRAMQSVAEPVSVSTPTEVWFVAEPVVPPKHEVEDLAPDMEVSPEPVFDSAAESTEPAPPAPEPEPPFADIPPAWPDAEAVPAEVVDQATDPPVPEGSGAPRAVPEGYEQFAPMPPPIPDVLDQVLPPPTSPPSTPATSRPTESSTPSHPGSDSRSAPGRVVAVMAGKGGSGKTVTVTNLAIALGLRRDPERVAIVDADLQFGDVALMLQIDPVRTLGDLVGEVESLSDERVDAALLRHKSGTRVLPAPVAPVGSAGISAKSVVEVIDRLRSMFDTVVVDTGPVFDDFLVTVLESADDVVVVVDMDLPSVKNAKVALDGLRQIGFDMGRIRLVMNRADSKVSLDLAEVERTLGLRIGGSIPSDRVIPQGVNDGVPALSRSPRTKVARAFHALAESLDSTEVKDRITGQ